VYDYMASIIDLWWEKKYSKQNKAEFMSCAFNTRTTYFIVHYIYLVPSFLRNTSNGSTSPSLIN